MYNLAIKFLPGHIQIHQKGFDEKSQLIPPVDITLKNSSKIISEIGTDPDIHQIKRRIEFPCFISNGTNKIGGMVNAIEPGNEQHEVFMERLLTGGKYEGSRPIRKGNEVMIGAELADLFNFSIGDELTIVADNKYKQPNMDIFEIVGIFSSGFPLFDETFIFIPLERGRKFMDYEKDEVNVIHIKLSSIKQVPKIRDLVDKRTGHAYEVFSWEHFSPEIVKGVQADQNTYNMIIGVLLFLMTIGLVNTMSMNVFERYSEIGTLRALGFTKNEISLMFVGEGVLTGLGGFILGLIIGSLANWYLATVGFTIPQESFTDVSIPMWDRFLAKPLFSHVVVSFFLGILIPAAGAFYPVRKALRKPIVDTLYFIK